MLASLELITIKIIPFFAELYISVIIAIKISILKETIMSTKGSTLVRNLLIAKNAAEILVNLVIYKTIY
jgi:hypothetical protein